MIDLNVSLMHTIAIYSYKSVTEDDKIGPLPITICTRIYERIFLS